MDMISPVKTNSSTNTVTGMAWPYGSGISPAAPDPNIRIEIENVELWRKFHQYNNEMILTKSGRRMFPSLRFKLSGLDASSNYSVLMEFVSTDDCRYKFQRGSWIVSGRADSNDSALRSVLHHDSPSPGSIWMRQSVTFCRLKLTNHLSPNSSHDQVLLSSMHKYVPRLYVVKMSDTFPNMQQVVAATSFPETAFIAVTAYQNDAIIKLKIDNNPFAKGFRDTATCKRSATPEQRVLATPIKRMKLSPPDECGLPLKSILSLPDECGLSPKSTGVSPKSLISPPISSPSGSATSSKDILFSPLPSPNPFAGLNNMYPHLMPFPHMLSHGFLPPAWSTPMPPMWSTHPQFAPTPFAAGLPFPWLSSFPATSMQGSM